MGAISGFRYGIVVAIAGVISAGLTANAVAADRFFVSDRGSQQVHKYSDEFTQSGNWPTLPGNGVPDDVYITDTEVYVLDATAKKVFRYDYAGQNGVESAVFKIPGTSASADIGLPNGMSVDVDGGEIRLTDQSRIYRYNLADAFSGAASVNALNQWNLQTSNSQPHGLTLDPTYAYVLDYGQQRLYRYLRSNPAAGHTPSRKFRDEAGVKLTHPEGVAVSGDLLYVLNNDTSDRIYRYSMFDVFLDPGNANAFDSSALAPGNTDPYGVGIDQVLAAASVTPETFGPTNADTLNFEVHFSEDVMNFNDIADLETTATGTAFTGVNITGSGKEYNVELTGITGNGIIQLAVSTESDVTDLGSDALYTSAVSQPVIIDNTAPVAQGIVPNSGSEIVLTFTEAHTMHPDALLPSTYAVSGLGIGSLSLNPTTVTDLGNNSYQLNWAGMSSINGLNISILVSPTLTDIAGNLVDPLASTVSAIALPVSLSGFTVE